MIDEQTGAPSTPVDAAVQTAAPATAPAPSASAGSLGPRRGGDAGRRGGPGGGRPRRRDGREQEVKEFDQRTLELARVTRVTAGGKRMRFRAAIVIGDRKGRVGFGVAKGIDVQAAMQKAYHQAKKAVRHLPLVKGTFPHRADGHFGSADIILMPAPKGTGLKSGGAVRLILELGGVGDAVSKIVGASNKITVAKATLRALDAMRVPKRTMTDSDAQAKTRKEQRDEAARKITKRPADATAPAPETTS